MHMCHASRPVQLLFMTDALEPYALTSVLLLFSPLVLAHADYHSVFKVGDVCNGTSADCGTCDGTESCEQGTLDHMCAHRHTG